jgi:hypothetical protein
MLDSTISNNTFNRCYDSAILLQAFDGVGVPENNIVENNWFGPTLGGVNNCCFRGDGNPANETFDHVTVRFNSSVSHIFNKSGTVLNNVSFIGNIALTAPPCGTGTNILWAYNVYGGSTRCGPTDTIGATQSSVQFMNPGAAGLNLHVKAGSVALAKVPTSLAGGCGSVSGGRDKDGDRRPAPDGVACDAGADERS